MIRISIIIPIYHGKRYLSSLLNMVKENTIKLNSVYPEDHVEVILVNDSPDEPLDEIPMSSEYVTRIIEHKNNSGIHASRVEGLNVSKGEYICFWDQDDEWKSEYLLEQFKKMNDLDVLICNGIFRNNVRIMKNSDDILAVTKPNEYIRELKGIISPGQAMIRKDSIPEAWTTNLLKCNYCDDAFLWILMKNFGKTFAVNTEILYKHREHNYNASQNFESNINGLREMLDALKKGIVSNETLQVVKKGIQARLLVQKNCHKISLDLKKTAENKEKVNLWMNNNKVSSVSLYGMGMIGMMTLNTFKDMGFQITHLYDRIASSEREVILNISESRDDSDLLLITIAGETKDIMTNLKSYTSGRVMGIQEFLESVDKVTIR